MVCLRPRREDSCPASLNPEVTFGPGARADPLCTNTRFVCTGRMSVGFIGAGQVAQSLVRGFAAAGESASNPEF